jgi:hypothetical protein
VDAAIAFLLAASGPTAGFALQLHNSLRRTPSGYSDREWVAFAFEIQMRLIIPSLLALLVACLFIRKRWPESNAMSHVVMQWAMLVALWGSFITGLYTFSFGMGALFGLASLGLLSSRSESYAPGSSPSLRAASP